jgi:glutathione reductase (NADPH)
MAARVKDGMVPTQHNRLLHLQVLELKELPSVVTLIGGGYIGMEFAGMFARLGCEVHVIARQDLPLAPRFDEEVRGGSTPPSGGKRG